MDFRLETQITSDGATWLDRNLVAREPPPLAQSGFGDEVREALERRTDHLASEGLARRARQRAVFARDLLDTLERRELSAVAAKITAETGLPRQAATEGEHVAGVYRQRVQLASGRFAMIDNGPGFELVPWKPALEEHLGRQVSGVVLPGGGVDWSFGRNRGLGIGWYLPCRPPRRLAPIGGPCPKLRSRERSFRLRYATLRVGQKTRITSECPNRPGCDTASGPFDGGRS